MIRLAKNFSMPATEYAIQKNAIIGIPNTGKTYTAMKIAEQLLGVGIPIIAFDPVGVWKNLKIGVGHPGYPIVVAGGPGNDILLTKENCADIVKAAMKEGISLVIDLHSRELAQKATWIKIVQACINTLLYPENDEFSLRHIFLEEAAEFIPQKLMPQQFMVYSAIESLARMGRNMHLGLTIINQRSEEVNKAILEICEMSLLHKQTGKNSLISIEKWFKVRQVENYGPIMKELPKLQKGQCWVIQSEHEPRKIDVLAKNTFHPSPDKAGNEHIKNMPAKDVSTFVKRMNAALEKPKESAESAVRKETHRRLTDPKLPGIVYLKQEDHDKLMAKLKQDYANSQEMIKQLTSNNAELQKRYLQAQKVVASMLGIGTGFLGKGEPLTEIKAPAQNDAVTTRPVQALNKKIVTGYGSLGKCAHTILAFLASYPTRSFKKVQVAIGSGYSHTSSGFSNALSNLNVRGLIQRSGDRIQVDMPAAKPILGDFEPLVYDRRTFINKLGKCEREIYEVLLDHPDTLYAKGELAMHTPSQYSVTSSGFSNALSALSTLELIKREGSHIRLNPELLEL